MIGEVILEGIEFFAYHGFYNEERKLGNKYGIDLTITANLEDSPLNDDLSQTIDYETVYQLVKREVEKPTKLLESIAYRIIHSILLSFHHVISVEVAVSKFNPPVGGICHKAKVKLKKVRDNDVLSIR